MRVDHPDAARARGLFRREATEDEEKGLVLRITYHEAGSQVQCMVYVGELGHTFRNVGRLVLKHAEWVEMRPMLEEFCNVEKFDGNKGGLSV